mgnify:CR=1 FL=1
MDLYASSLSPLQRLRDLRDVVRANRPPLDVQPIPHLDAASLALLMEGLESCTSYLEYGSGGSTLLAAQTGKQVFSVENDLKFARVVRDSLGPDDKVNLTTIDLGKVRAWAVPVNTRPTPANVARWSKYPIAPWLEVARLGSPLPDFVLVDGRFRVASAATSLGQLQGLTHARVMVDDYIMRPEYWVLEAIGELQGIHGRAAVFTPKPVDSKKLQSWIGEYQRDWR